MFQTGYFGCLRQPRSRTSSARTESPPVERSAQRRGRNSCGQWVRILWISSSPSNGFDRTCRQRSSAPTSDADGHGLFRHHDRCIRPALQKKRPLRVNGSSAEDVEESRQGQVQGQDGQRRYASGPRSRAETSCRRSWPLLLPTRGFRTSRTVTRQLKASTAVATRGGFTSVRELISAVHTAMQYSRGSQDHWETARRSRVLLQLPGTTSLAHVGIHA